MNKVLHKDMFGKPGEGIHRHFYGIAIWDVVFTVVAAIVASYFLDVPFWQILLGFFIMGEGMHLAFGVDTAVIRLFKRLPVRASPINL